MKSGSCIIGAILLHCQINFTSGLCVLPNIYILESHSEYQYQILHPNENGEISFGADTNGINIWCNSSQPVNIMYIQETFLAAKMELSDDSLESYIRPTENGYQIKQFWSIQNGKFHVQQFCTNVKSACGNSEIIIDSQGNSSALTGKIVEHKDSLIPPLRREKIPDSEEMPRNQTCAFRFFVKQVSEENKILGGNCTVNYKGKEEKGKLELLSTPRNAIHIEAVLRNWTTNEGCITFVREDEECLNCDLFDYEHPTPQIIECKYKDHNALGFFFGDFSKYNGQLETLKMYNNWNDMNPDDMMFLKAPDSVYEEDELSVFCIVSDFVFSKGFRFAYRYGPNDDWTYSRNYKTDSWGMLASVNSFTREEVSYREYFEVMCAANVWNSTEYFNQTQRIHINREKAATIPNSN